MVDGESLWLVWVLVGVGAWKEVRRLTSIGVTENLGARIPWSGVHILNCFVWWALPVGPSPRRHGDSQQAASKQ